LTDKIAQSCLDQLFLSARTHNAGRERDVLDALLHHIVDLAKLGPTSANCSPARFLFVKSRAAKERLKPHLSEGNRDKTMKAPVCAIIGTIPTSTNICPSIFPYRCQELVCRQEGENLRQRLSQWHAAGRLSHMAVLGLDCGPMSGFDNQGVDREFFAGTNVKSNFLCNLGYGDGSVLFPRSPHFEFDEMARIL
jgi:3-hydroxypropanoate dehydrogenase